MDSRIKEEVKRIIIIFLLLFGAQKFNLEVQSRFLRNSPSRKAGIAIGIVRGASQSSTFSNLHGQNSFVPSLDDFSLA